MYAPCRRDRSLRSFFCCLLATLTTIGPAGLASAQQPPRPEVPVQPVEDPEGVSRDKTLLAEPAVKPVAFDLSFVLPNSCVIIAARPAQVLKAPSLEMLPYEVIQAATIQALQLDPFLAEQIVFCVEPPAQGPPNYTAFAKFSEPVQVESEQLTAHTQPGQLNGKAYRQSSNPIAPSLYQPTDKSLLLAPDSLLKSLVPRNDVESAGDLKTRFAAAANGDDLLAMFDLAALRPMIQMGMGQAEFPPPLAPLKELPDLLALAELRLNLSGQGPTELILTANNEEDAQQVVRLVEQIKQDLLAMATRQSQQMLNSDDPVEQAMGRYQQRMQQQWGDWLQLQRDGARLVVFHVDPAGENPQTQVVYVATVGVLVALLLPAVQAAREAARRNTSVNHMKQIMLGLLNYESVHAQMPAHANYGDDDKPLLSWRVHILPYLEEQALYEQFHLDEPWDSEHNKQLIAQMPAVYLDPSSALAVEEGKTHYLGVSGKNSYFDGTDAGRKLQEITDGTSNTVCVVQVADDATATWTKPEDWEYDPEKPLRGLGGLHPGGFQAALGDGSVHFISNDIALDVWRAMLTVDGGEVVPRF